MSHLYVKNALTIDIRDFNKLKSKITNEQDLDFCQDYIKKRIPTRNQFHTWNLIKKTYGLDENPSNLENL